VVGAPSDAEGYPVPTGFYGLAVLFLYGFSECLYKVNKKMIPFSSLANGQHSLHLVIMPLRLRTIQPST
jgi:hypothetical protein